jgi:hypothetical protein
VNCRDSGFNASSLLAELRDIDPIARPTLFSTPPTLVATNLCNTGNNAETLHFTTHFEISRSGNMTEHTMTYDWIPRRF